MKNRVFRWIILTLIGGCAAPGLQSLKENSIYRTVTVSGDPRRLANCVATQFDKEPNGLGEIAMPAEGWREPEEGVIQIFNSSYTSQTASPGAFAYFATFRRQDDGKVEVDIYASRNVHIYLPADYVIGWFDKHLKYCTGSGDVGRGAASNMLREPWGSLASAAGTMSPDDFRHLLPHA